MASYEPTVSLRPDHVKKLRRGRKFGRGRSRVKRDKGSDEDEEDLYEDMDEVFEDSKEKIIEERSAVYPKHHGKERLHYIDLSLEHYQKDILISVLGQFTSSTDLIPSTPTITERSQPPCLLHSQCVNTSPGRSVVRCRERSVARYRDR